MATGKLFLKTSFDLAHSYSYLIHQSLDAVFYCPSLNTISILGFLKKLQWISFTLLLNHKRYIKRLVM